MTLDEFAERARDARAIGIISESDIAVALALIDVAKMARWVYEDNLSDFLLKETLDALDNALKEPS